MKLIVEIEMREGEHPAEALRRELLMIVSKQYPLRIPLPGNGVFEVIVPQPFGEPRVLGRLDTQHMPDGLLSFEIRRLDEPI